MRISDSQFSQMMLQSLQINNAGLGHVLQQMATGDRLTKLSDDPMASIKLLNLSEKTVQSISIKATLPTLKRRSLLKKPTWIRSTRARGECA
ncbi:flagellar hook-associated protein [Vibrio sp. AND4]|nr:flagellar hook-associated protein [Vibrio sp. AND4]